MTNLYIKKEHELLMDINVKYVVSFFLADKIMTEEEIYWILNQENREKQTQTLLDVLEKKKNGLSTLIKAVQYDDAYPWIYEALLNYKDDDITVNNLLLQGGVPYGPKYLIDRNDQILEVQTALEKVATSANNRGWVVLHGMMGIGKSVLAAECLRKAEFTLNYFPDGVWWVGIGRSADEASLLNKLQNLYERMMMCPTFNKNAKRYPSATSLETITQNLMLLVSQSNKKIVVVVDDIAQETFVKAFDIGCPILATTNTPSVFDKVSGPKYLVQVQHYMSNDEARELLALYSETSSANLPKAVDTIIDRCKGLPWELSIVGSLISHFVGSPNLEARWNKISEEYTSNVGRTRRDSSDYNNAFKVIEMCIDKLVKEDSTYQDYYQSFVLFMEDTNIPSKVFEILWEKDELAVEDIMIKLYNHSLIKKQRDFQLDCTVYAIHDLYLLYLKQKCEENIKKLHQKLLEKYLKICEVGPNCYDYSKLPNDHYIYYFLAYHLDRAERHDLLCRIFLDLKFVIKKLQLIGPGDLLNDFKTYEAAFKEHAKEKEDLVGFIKACADVILKEDVDILQLALRQQDFLTVYEKAKELALQTPDKIYLEWLNYSNVPKGAQTSFRIFEKPIRCAVFNPSTTLIASAGDDNIIKILCPETQKIIHTFSGHKKPVTCCQFSEDGKILLTTSLDSTIKLWKIEQELLDSPYIKYHKSRPSLYSPTSPKEYSYETDMAFKTLPHEAEVLWGSFAPCTSSKVLFIVSGDALCNVNVWDLDNGVLIKRFIGHEKPVTHCEFSQDCNYITSSSSVDHTVRVWDFKLGHQVACFNHDPWPVCASYFSDDNNFIISTSINGINKCNIKDNSMKNLNQYNKHYIIFSTISPNKKSLAFVTSDHRIIILDLNKNEITSNFKNHSETLCIDFSHDQIKLLSGTSLGTVQVWDLNKNNSSSLIQLSQKCSIKFTKDGPLIASPDNKNRVQILEGLRGTPKITTPQEDDIVKSCCLSNDLKSLLYVTENGFVKIWSLEENKVTFSQDGKCTFTHCLFFQNDEKFITSSSSGLIRIWSKNGSYVNCEKHEGIISEFKLFNNESHLLSCSHDGKMIVWDVKSGLHLCIYAGHSKETVTCCDVTANGKLLLSASVDKTAKIWNFPNEATEPSPGPSSSVITSGEQEKLTAPSPIRCCTFSPNSQFIALGTDDSDIFVWKLSEAKAIQICHFKHEFDWVHGLLFSPCSHRLVSVADSIKWWDIKSSRNLQTFNAQSSMKFIAASPDFQTFVTRDEAGILYILKILPNNNVGS